MKSVGEIISTYRKKAKYTQPVLAEKLAEHGIKVSFRTISGWEQGVSEPSIGTFLCICLILGIPDCIEEMYGQNPHNPMAQLNDEGKDKVIEYIDTLIHPVSYLKESNVISFTAHRRAQRSLRLYDARVSAGTGDFMDSEQYSLIQIDEDKYPSADFAVTINGDSMEPVFPDHSVAYVHKQETLENGEIGIFYLNGNAYIKQLQDDEHGLYLVSLNKKYDPIQVDPSRDSFRIFGRVCRE